MNLDSAVFYTNDINIIVPYYRDVIGLKLENQMGDKFATFIFPNSVRLGIKKQVEEREIPGHQTIFICVEDLKSSYEKFKKLNLRFGKDLVEEKWGLEFSILDPDGNKILFRSVR